MKEASGELSMTLIVIIAAGVIVMIFASTLGKGVIFSAIPLFLYQGGITCIAALFGDFMSTAMIDGISFVGSALIFCVGINVAFGKKFPVGNMLPSLLIPAIYIGIQGLF